MHASFYSVFITSSGDKLNIVEKLIYLKGYNFIILTFIE
jgi:hypothetical protein